MPANRSLTGKKILLGVTGGIAAYKSVEALRRLKQMGADVTVVMTASAREFVGPLTFEALCGHPVPTDMFSKDTGSQIPHIALAHWPDLVVIAPATANTVGKIAAGLADDLLSALVMATPAPVLLAPAMETNMYQNPIVTENLARLRGLGYRTVGPGKGFLASGGEGVGRPAGAFDADDVDMGHQKDRLLRAGAAEPGHEIAAAGGGLVDAAVDAVLRQHFGDAPEQGGLVRVEAAGAGGRRIGGVEADEFAEQVDGLPRVADGIEGAAVLRGRGAGGGEQEQEGGAEAHDGGLYLWT